MFIQYTTPILYIDILLLQYSVICRDQGRRFFLHYCLVPDGKCDHRSQVDAEGRRVGSFFLPSQMLGKEDALHFKI